jgi:cytochrome o ubiquinol oxidase subunit II
MSRKQKLTTLAVLILGLLILAAVRLHHSTVAGRQTRGTIGQQEKRLIITAVLLSLIVVIPVYGMLIGFAWKYRAGNKKARYDPSFDHSRWLESLWWGVPMVLILILGLITWRSSHQLDPFKPLDSSVPPMTIQVVALQWKWLFIYPKQNIASLNYVQFPVNRPIKFQITSDAPMNSFWIPQLGGQIYAMSGMATNLNLEASQAGSYEGLSANISGEGFAGMHFIAKASSQSGFNQWVNSIKNHPGSLTAAAYNKLAKPSQNNPIDYFASAQNGLFDSIVQKYLAPVYFNPAETGQ